MMNMVISTIEHGPTTVVGITGEIDLETATKLRTVLEQLVAADRVDLVLDLAGLEFVDSTGLGILVGCLKAVRQRDGWIRIAAVNERILRLLTITGLERILPVHDTVEQALAAGPVPPSEATAALAGGSTRLNNRTP